MKTSPLVRQCASTRERRSARLCSVRLDNFSSAKAPRWLRPFHVVSTPAQNPAKCFPMARTWTREKATLPENGGFVHLEQALLKVSKREVFVRDPVSESVAARPSRFGEKELFTGDFRSRVRDDKDASLRSTLWSRHEVAAKHGFG